MPKNYAFSWQGVRTPLTPLVWLCHCVTSSTKLAVHNTFDRHCHQRPMRGWWRETRSRFHQRWGAVHVGGNTRGSIRRIVDRRRREEPSKFRAPVLWRANWVRQTRCVYAGRNSRMSRPRIVGRRWWATSTKGEQQSSSRLRRRAKLRRTVAVFDDSPCPAILSVAGCLSYLICQA